MSPEESASWKFSCSRYWRQPCKTQVPLSPVFARYWALAHAITRQESSFDRAAVSNAGARGMMQLMPGTAREVAGKLGLPYEFSRLTAVPDDVGGPRGMLRAGFADDRTIFHVPNFGRTVPTVQRLTVE